jgi:hypothetical protein
MIYCIHNEDREVYMSTYKDMIYVVDGVECLTINDFAKLMCRSRSTITSWMMHGNRFRKLKVLRDAKKRPFIPFNELFDFPVSVSGRNFDTVYTMQLQDGALRKIRTEHYCSAVFVVKCTRECNNGCNYYRELTEDGSTATV